MNRVRKIHRKNKLDELDVCKNCTFKDTYHLGKNNLNSIPKVNKKKYYLFAKKTVKFLNSKNANDTTVSISAINNKISS